jgi:hypothetical protein
MPEPVQTLEYEASPGRWRFSSAAPHPPLLGIVQEYWEVEGRLTPFRERVLPNGYTEVMINLGPPHQLLTSAGTRTSPDSYRAEESQRTGEKWKQMWTMELKRSADQGVSQ